MGQVAEEGGEMWAGAFKVVPGEGMREVKIIVVVCRAQGMSLDIW